MMTPKQPGRSDSPWFWAAVFLGAALLAALAVWPRYEVRMTGMLRRHEARQSVLEQQSAPEAAVASPTENPTDDLSDDLTWLLAGAVVIAVATPVIIAGAWMLTRSRSDPSSKWQPTETHP